MTRRRAFTLVELLVVIAIIAVLLAIFIPVTCAARERGQRAVCLSNLRQLTTAWIAYADDHDAKLVNGCAFAIATGAFRKAQGWIGRAFLFPESRVALLENPDKVALWGYVRDVDVYRCPRGWAGHAATYATVPAVNGDLVEGTYLPAPVGYELTLFGKRVGSTVLRLTRLTDIVSPGAGQRAVFIDKACTPHDFEVYYLYPKWVVSSPPPTHHADGTTLSMADGHAEYWRWKGRETIKLPRKRVPAPHDLSVEHLEAGDYEPKTEDGLYDLQRLQRATWGRLGYPAEDTP